MAHKFWGASLIMAYNLVDVDTSAGQAPLFRVSQSWSHGRVPGNYELDRIIYACYVLGAAH